MYNNSNKYERCVLKYKKKMSRVLFALHPNCPFSLSTLFLISLTYLRAWDGCRDLDEYLISTIEYYVVYPPRELIIIHQ